MMPSPRKVRVITERDERGRIVGSKVPQMAFVNPRYTSL